jgi:hypothetical protein
VKVLYGLLAIGLFALVIVWIVGSAATDSQVEAGPVGVLEGTYDPVRAGEETPSGYRQVLPRDAILPVYNPTFRSAAQSDWSPETLVIGLELGGEAKAYPVSFLNGREMVIDWIGGSPVLVTW